MRTLLTHCDLVYARDAVSLSILHELGFVDQRFRYCPDYTGSINSLKRDPSLTHTVCFVPNYRIIEKLEDVSEDAYLHTLSLLSRDIGELGLNALFVIHQTGDDLKLARRLKDDGNAVVHEEDPLALKAIIGSCYCVVSSRYHGIASALSQSVPTISVGWAHKYREIMSDYGTPEYDIPFNYEDMKRAIVSLTVPDQRRRVIATLGAGSRNVETNVLNMWSELTNFLVSPRQG